MTKKAVRARIAGMLSASMQEIAMQKSEITEISNRALCNVIQQAREVAAEGRLSAFQCGHFQGQMCILEVYFPPDRALFDAAKRELDALWAKAAFDACQSPGSKA